MELSRLAEETRSSAHYTTFDKEAASWLIGGLVLFGQRSLSKPVSLAGSCSKAVNGSQDSGQPRPTSAARFTVRMRDNTKRAPGFARLGMFLMREYFTSVSKAAIYISSRRGLWPRDFPGPFSGTRADSRKRWILLSCVLLASGVLAALTPLVWSHIFCARFQPRISSLVSTF